MGLRANHSAKTFVAFTTALYSPFFVALRCSQNCDETHQRSSIDKLDEPSHTEYQSVLTIYPQNRTHTGHSIIYWHGMDLFDDARRYEGNDKP